MNLYGPCRAPTTSHLHQLNLYALDDDGVTLLSRTAYAPHVIPVVEHLPLRPGAVLYALDLCSLNHNPQHRYHRNERG